MDYNQGQCPQLLWGDLLSGNSNSSDEKREMMSLRYARQLSIVLCLMYCLTGCQKAPPKEKVNPMGLWLAQLRYDDETARTEALEALRAFGEPAISILLDNLKHDHKNIKISAAWALSRLEPTPEGAVEALKPLLDVYSEEVKTAAAEAIARIEGKLPDDDTGTTDEPVEKEKMTVQEIQRALTGRGLSAKRRAVDALEELDDAGSLIPALMKILRDEPSLFVIEALGIIGDKRAVAPLMAIAKDPDNLHRNRAIRALGQIGDESAMPLLLSKLNDISFDSTDLIAGIAGFGEKAVGPLLEMLKQRKGRDNSVLLSALAATQAPSALPELAKRLKHEDSTQRAVAAHALTHFGHPSAIPALRDLFSLEVLSDKRVDTRESVVLALAAIGEPAVSALLEATADETVISSDKKTIAGKARTALKKIIGKNESYVPLLIASLKDKDKDTRRSAAWLLGEIGHYSAATALSKTAINDKDDYVQIAACTALTRIPHRDAYREMMLVLENAYYGRTRYPAVHKFGELGDTLAVPSLMKVLRRKTSDGQYALDMDVEKALRRISGRIMSGSLSERYKQWQAWYRENW